MKYLWIVFIIMVYIVAWVVFVVKVIDEINCCKRSCEKPSVTDFLAWIFANDYIIIFLIAHVAMLFFVSFFMFCGEYRGE